MLLAMDSCACLMGTRTFSPAVISYPASPFQRRIPALCMPSIVAVASRHSAIIMSTGSPGPQPTPLPLSSGRVNACIGALLLLFAANQWSRSLIFYLVDFSATERSPAELAEAARLFVNVDLSFDAAQYGLLASIGFASLFSLVSLIAGGVVDRLDARAVLAISGMLWSASYAWQASAASFGELAAARLLSGVGQAFGNPASYTALGKLVPPERRATANGIYSSGIYIGGGLAALSVILDQQLGWRGLSALAAVAGVATSALVFTTLPPLPPSAAFETPVDEESSKAERSEPLLSSRVSPASSVSSKEVPEEAPPAAEALSELLDTAGIKWLLLGSTLRFMAGFSVGVWIVPFFRGEFPTQIGAEFALLKVRRTARSSCAKQKHVLPSLSTHTYKHHLALPIRIDAPILYAHAMSLATLRRVSMASRGPPQPLAAAC